MRSDPSAAADALRLYRGPFLEDFNERGAGTRLVRWVAAKRKELEAVFLAACDDGCREAAAREDWEEVAELAQLALRHVPGWEPGNRWLELGGRSRAEQAPGPAVVASPTQREEPLDPLATPAPTPAGSDPLPPQPRLWRSVVAPVAMLLLGAVGVWTWGQVPPRSAAPVDQLAVGSTGAERATPVAAPVCEPGAASGLLVDEVFYYGTRVRPGRPFRKAWVLQNVGGCTWGTDFRLHYMESGGERLSRTIMDIPLRKPVLPGQRDTFEVPMQAPMTPGIHGETWQLRDGGDRPVRIGNSLVLRAGVKVPLPHYPPCKPGEGAGLILVRKFPAGTVLGTGTSFRYSWTIKNTAECSWGPGAAMRFRDHSNGRLSREAGVVASQTVEPDETYTFLVEMRAPARPGVFAETWELQRPDGTPIPVGGSPAVGMQVRVVDDDDVPAPAPVCGPGEAQIQFYDENWRDSTRVRPGQRLTKRWTAVNNGTCTWGADFLLRYTGNTGGQLAVSRADRPLGEAVPPGAAYTFEVPMRVPEHRGFIREDWRFMDATGAHIMIGTSPYLAAILTVERPPAAFGSGPRVRVGVLESPRAVTSRR